jgi:hypothetical protein
MKQEAKGARAGGAARIKEIFDEAIREAIPVADESTAPAPPRKRGRITEAFDEAIRTAIPAEGEGEQEGRGGGDD